MEENSAGNNISDPGNLYILCYIKNVKELGGELMYQIGSKWLLASREEIKEFKDRVLSRPCNDEISYHKRITELKDVVKDQDHELFVQKQRITELEKQLKAKETSTIHKANPKVARIERATEYTVCSNYPSREEVTKQIQEEVGSAMEIKDLKDKLALAKVKYDRLLKEKEETAARIQRIVKSYENVIDERNKLSEELKEIRSRLKDYHDDIEYSTLKSKYDLLNAAYKDLKIQYDGLNCERNNEELVIDTTCGQEKSECACDIKLREVKENFDRFNFNLDNYIKKVGDLKASYDNLMDDNSQLKRENARLKSALLNEPKDPDNTDALTEAKIIIDSLQKENAALKAQLSDREAHNHCETDDYEDLKEQYDKILRENVLMMSTESQRKAKEESLRKEYDSYRDRMDRIVKEELVKDHYLLGLSDYLDDAMKILSRIGVTNNEVTKKFFVQIDGIKYQTSMKLHQVASKLVEDIKTLERCVSSYRNADLEEIMNEDDEEGK